MNFSDIIETDLKQLLNETKRKYPQIKDDIQNALNFLQNSRSSQSDRQSQQMKQNELPIADIMQAIQKIPETKNQRIYEIGMQILQKLANLQILNKNYQQQMLDFLFTIKQIVTSGDDNFNLKLVQMVLMLISPKFIDFKALDSVEKILHICMQLLVSKNILIHNSCIVGAQQVMHIAFEVFSKLVKTKQQMQYNQQALQDSQGGSQTSLDGKMYKNLEKKLILTKKQSTTKKTEEDLYSESFNNNSEMSDGGQSSPKQYERIFKNAQIIIEDLLKFYTKDIPPSWISEQNLKDLEQKGIYHQICFDLLIFILKEAGSSLEEVPQFYSQLQNTLEQQMTKDLDDLLNQEKVQFAGAVRVFRCLNRLQTNLYCGYNIYKKILNYLHKSQKLSLYTFIISETIGEFLGKCNVLAYVIETENIQTHQMSLDELSQSQQQIDNIKNAFQSLTFIGKMIGTLQVNDLKVQKKMTNIKSNLISENWTDFPNDPVISYIQIYKSLLDSLLKFQDSLLVIVQNIPMCQLGQKLQNFKQAQESHEFILLQKIILNYWKDNLKLTKHLFQFDIDESITQQILNLIQNWISICGTMQLQKPKDQFLKLLSQYSLDSATLFTSKNNQTTKVIFNITHGLQKFLDTNSWHIIFETLQKLEFYFGKKQRNNEDDSQDPDHEIKILSSLLEQTFMNTPTYDDEMLLQILDALNTVTLQILETKVYEQSSNQSQMQSSAASLSHVNEKFALKKILETVSLNFNRIYLFWDLVSAHFLLVANSKHDNLRLYSIEVLNTIINNAFLFFLKIFNNNNNEEQVDTRSLSVKFQQLLKSSDSKWSAVQWQETLFQPYLDIIRSKFSDTKEFLLQNLLRLIQNNGHKINGKGFKIILEVLNQVAEIDYGKYITSYAFHCLETIINQHIHCIDNKKYIKIILSLIEHFKLISSDQNITYLSVTMFWNVSDHLTKLHSNSMQKIDNLKQKIQKYQMKLEQKLEKQRKCSKEETNNSQVQSSDSEQENLQKSNNEESSLYNSQQDQDKINEDLNTSERKEKKKQKQRQKTINLQNRIVQIEEKIQQKQKELQELQEIEIPEYESLWMLLFSKLTILCLEKTQGEVRQSSLHTYSQIIVNNSYKIYSQKFWNQIVKDSYLNLVENAIDLIETESNVSFAEKARMIETPKFAVNETPKFASGGGFQFNQPPPAHLPDLPVMIDIKDWHETLKSILVNLNKIIRKTSKSEMENHQKYYIEESLWVIIIQKISKVLKIDSYEVKLEGLKIMKEMIIYTDIALIYPQQFNEFLNGITYLVENIPKQQNGAKLLVQKIIPQLIQNFEHFYSKNIDYSEQNQEILQKITRQLTEIYQQIFNTVRQIDIMNIMSPYKVWDEQPCYLLINNIIGKMLDKPEYLQEIIFDFLIGVIKNTQINCIFNDLISRNFMKAFSQLLQNSNLSLQTKEKYINQFYETIQNILDLRFSYEYYTFHQSFPKKIKVQPLWVQATNSFLEVSNYQISQNILNQKNFQIIEDLLKRPIDKLKILPEKEKNVIFQQLSDIEFQCVEYLIQILTSEQEHEEDFLNKIIQILQGYTQNLQQKHQQNNQSDSLNYYETQKKYLQNLFRISDMNKSSHESIVKISRTVIPLLIMRCRDILEDFIDIAVGDDSQSLDEVEEVKSNPDSQQQNSSRQNSSRNQNGQQQQNQDSFRNTPQYQYKVNEVIFILQELLILELPLGSFQQVPKNINKSPIKEKEKEKEDQQQQQSQQQEQGSTSISNLGQAESKSPKDLSPERQHMNMSLSRHKFESQHRIKIVSDNPFLTGKKAHLLYFFPLFTSMMLVPVQDIQINLQQIFFEISSEMSLSDI